MDMWTKDYLENNKSFLLYVFYAGICYDHLMVQTGMMTATIINITTTTTSVWGGFLLIWKPKS